MYSEHMKEQSLSYYLERYAAGHITPEERTKLNELLQDPANEEFVQRIMDAEWASLEQSDLEFPEGIARLHKAVEDAIRKEAVIAKKDAPVHRVHFLRKWGWAAAAIVVTVIAANWFRSANNETQKTEVVMTVPDLDPGQDGAILTLADGRKIVLDSLSAGLIAHENGTQINLVDGKIVYNSLLLSQDTVLYNKLTTPRGRQYQLALPDGTRVWLNAQSSIEFPTGFSGGYRNVKITGEVYFDVAQNASSVFRVHIGDRAKVDVLGTSFNINAYENEGQIQASLLSGAIKFSALGSNKSYVLKPGDQVQMGGDPEAVVHVNKAVEMDRVLAWKNGVFSFEGLTLQEILRQLERWYDFKVVYKNKPSTFLYRGGMDRNVKFSEILEVFKEMGVKYKWEGEILIIE